MNNKESNNRQIFILGAALFSMFFGAGNLIFPPSLGLQSGSKWIFGLAGFFLTGIGLPLLGIIASAKCGGSLDNLGKRVSPGFSVFLGVSISLAIGPLLAIPRTGATAYEMAGLALFPNLSPVIFAILYFGIALLLVLNESDVVDTIGKYLTPGLLLLLATLIIVGIVNPAGTQVDTVLEKPFVTGFIEGYQTMDALASILFGGIIVASLKKNGVTDRKQQVNQTLKAGLVAVAGLTFVYGGLGYLGSLTGSIHSPKIARVDLIMDIAQTTLKSFGKYALSLVVSLACLTTTIGLISSISDYFEKLTDGRIKYKWLAIAMTLFSGAMSINGVEQIVKIAKPILVFLYPMTIVLITLTIFSKDENPNKNIYRGAVFFAMIIGFLEVLQSINISFAKSILSVLPLASWNLPWVVPAIIGGVIGALIPKDTFNTETSDDNIKI